MPGLGFQKVDSGALWEANLSQHQGLFQWVTSLHQVARVLELQLQHQSYSIRRPTSLPAWRYQLPATCAEWVNDLAYLSCCNKIPRIYKQQKFISQFWKLGSPRSGRLQILGLVMTPILTHRQLAFPCILTWLKGQVSSLGFLLKDTKQRHNFNNKNQSYGFSNSRVWMWELDCKEGWGLKNWCFRTVVLEKTLESPIDCKEIKPVNPGGDQPWKFIGRTDAEAEAPILWPPDAKSWFTGKTLILGKIGSRRRRGQQRKK